MPTILQQLSKRIPIEVIDEILKYISLECSFRLGAGYEKLIYLSKYIPFEGILENPKPYEEYDYIRRAEGERQSFYDHQFHNFNNWDKRKNLKFNMIRIPEEWFMTEYKEYDEYKSTLVSKFNETLSHHIWFLCDPILFKCYIKSYTTQMKIVLKSYERADSYMERSNLLIFHNRLDLLMLLSEEVISSMFKRDDLGYFRLVMLNNKDQELQIQVLRWLFENGMKWDMETLAAAEGKMQILEFLVKNQAQGLVTWPKI